MTSLDKNAPSHRKNQKQKRAVSRPKKDEDTSLQTPTKRAQKTRVCAEKRCAKRGKNEFFKQKLWILLQVQKELLLFSFTAVKAS